MTRRAGEEGPVSSARKWAALALWIFRDSAGRFKSRVVWSVATSAAGLALQVAGLAVILLFARAFDVNEDFGFAQFTFPSRSTAGVLVVLSFAFLLLTLSALLNYRSRLLVIGVSVRYEEHCLRQAFTLASELRDLPDSADLERLREHALRWGTTSDPRACGRVLDQLLELMLPAGTVLAFTTLLFWLNPLRTLLLVPVVLVSGLVLFRINRGAARTSRAVETAMKESVAERRALVIGPRGRAAEAEVPPSLDVVFSEGGLKSGLDALHERFRLEAGTKLVVSLLAATCVLGVVAASAIGVLSGVGSWTRLLTYLVVLRFALGSLGQVGSSLTVVSRFLPQVRRYHEFVKEAENYLARMATTAPQVR